jgi:DNA-binding transcriptional MocR family regulator
MWQPHLKGEGPIYIDLADAIEADVASGALKPGDRLPTHRDLADSLGVTVGTVTRGYAEAARRGMVRGEVGRGTVVRSCEAGGPWWSGGPDALARIDLGLVTDLGGQDPDLGAALRDIAGRPDCGELLHYQPSRGMPRHREAGAKWCALYGVDVSPEQVLVTSGGQHGLFVLLSGLFRPGDRVAAGQLNYPGLLSAAALLGIRLVPVALDEQGVVPESLEEVCGREGVRGLYCLPGSHNPTTASPTPERQERLAGIARARNLLVIEDGAYALTADAACTPIRRFVPERAFFICSVSKMVDGGLRVGFVAGPEEYVERLALGITSTTWMAAPLCGEIAAGWILDGTAQSVLRRKLAEAAARGELARRVLRGADFAAPRRGYFLWLRLPEPWRGPDFERAAGRRGVIVIAGDAFAVGQTPAPAAVRVSLSAARSRAELEAGLGVLAQLLAETPRPARAIV